MAGAHRGEDKSKPDGKYHPKHKKGHGKDEELHRSQISKEQRKQEDKEAKQIERNEKRKH